MHRSPDVGSAPAPLLYARLTRAIAAALAAYALIGGGVTLAGWCAGLPRLTDWAGTGIAMFANTAFAAICSGAALILVGLERRWSARIAGLLGLVVALLGGGTLLQHLFGVDLGIDHLLISRTWGSKAAMVPGRMGPPASVSFTLLGIALMLLSRGGRARRFAPPLGIVVCLIAGLSLMGYLFGADPLFAIARYTGIAMQTVTILMALGIAVVTSARDDEPMRTLRQDSAAGLLMRRSLPFLILLPIALGWLRVHGEDAGWFDTAMGTSLVMLVIVVLFCGLQWLWSGAVSRYEKALRIREKERTDLLNAERSARRSAEEAGRIKDEFLATLSHELRTPLSAILGWCKVIERAPGDLETVEEGLEVISRNAKAQANLVGDLLDMSRIVSGNLRLQVDDVDVKDVVARGTEVLRHAGQAKSIHLETFLPASPVVVRGDSSRLQQVIWNLLSNAVKFTPEGGRVDVRVDVRDSTARIVVQDTGIGIRPDFLPHVFERFRQSDASPSRRHGGLGLGLAIVKHLVELHGGAVLAESAGEGHGSRFTVELPLAEALRAPVRKAAPKVPRTAVDVDLRGVKALVIDDQPDMRDLLRRVLEESHAQVTLAASADEGLSRLKAVVPDVVLCDIAMPKMDGYEFIAQLRREGNRTPALAVTAYARSEDRERAMQAGYQEHVAKPVDAAELVAAVAAILGK